MTSVVHLKSFNQPSPPSQAWLAILAFIAVTAIALLARAGGILNLAFPIGALAVGLFLFFRAPILYLGFNWWIWFLSPLVARFVEYQTGALSSGLRIIIIAPYLVTLIAAITFFRHLPRLSPKEGLPFFLAFAAMLYSFGVGLARGFPIVEVVQTLLTWIPGVFLGFHLLVNWKDYPAFQQNTVKVFFWAVLVMGVYGVYQYVVAPDWDRFWLTNATNLQLCCGWPEPYMMRVWSTLNFPFTFAYVMNACLLILLSSQKSSNVIAIVAGLASFLLSQVRGAWIGCLIGLTLLFISLKSPGQIRLMAMVVSIGAVLIPIVTMTPLSEAITGRLQTLSSVQEDGSAIERQSIYAQNFDRVIFDPIGQGMGGLKLIDAGLLDVFSVFGWIGLIAFAPSIFLLLLSLFQYPDSQIDPFIKASRAILVSVLIISSNNNALVLMPGVLFWGFAGMAIAGHKYYRNLYQEDTLP